MYIIMNMNIYISKQNEEWLRIQGQSMSGIINRLLDEARAGKHGVHVLAQYETLEETQRSDVVRPNIPQVKSMREALENEYDTPDPYKDYILTSNEVIDKTTGEHVEATPEMVKELKRRGQLG